MKFDPNTDPQVVDKLRNVVPHRFKNLQLVERGEQRPLVKLEEVGCWYMG